MLKKWMLGAMLLSTSLSSQAGVITKIITGADMAGINVTVNFNNSSPSESDAWSIISSTPDVSPNSVIANEGLSGGASGTGWSLTQQGDSLGNFDNSTTPWTLYGLWAFEGDLSIIDSIVIDAGNTGILFDTIFQNTAAEFDANSTGQGRAFSTSVDTESFTTATYDNNLIIPGEALLPDELFTKLTIDINSATGDGFIFMADTDKYEVPEPSTLFTLALGLVALTSLRKKSSGK